MKEIIFYKDNKGLEDYITDYVNSLDTKPMVFDISKNDFPKEDFGNLFFNTSDYMIVITTEYSSLPQDFKNQLNQKIYNNFNWITKKLFFFIEPNIFVETHLKNLLNSNPISNKKISINDSEITIQNI